MFNRVTDNRKYRKCEKKMLSEEENRRLTSVNPGTPCGELMRRYWQPFLPAAKLSENPVQRVRLLGEDLVCYRDLSGTIGLIGDRCAHRSVSLEYGIPDFQGIRCPYHGWCYSDTGQCIDTPLEPFSSRLKDHVKIVGYPVQEMGGLLFAYLGPMPAPLLAPWDILVWPHAIRQIGYHTINCNWLQCQENAADPVHSVYTHGHLFEYILKREGLFEERAKSQQHRCFTSQRAAVGFDKVISRIDEYGLRKAMVYSKEKGATSDVARWHSYMVFPNYTRPGGGAIRHEFQMRVPMDDHHTLHFVYDMYAAPADIDIPDQVDIPCYEIPTRNTDGSRILDFVLAQDLVCWESQGLCTDRSRETLASTDEAIRRFRGLLNEQIGRVEMGLDPMNVFRDKDSLPNIIELPPRIGSKVPEDSVGVISAGARENFHLGFYRDDADRYGPLIPEVQKLMQAIADRKSERVGR